MTYVLDSKIDVDILTLAEVKLFLKVDAAMTEDDALISSLIKAATPIAEKAMNRDLLTGTWINYRDSFWAQDLTLRRGGFQNIDKIEYLINGSLETLSTDEYKSTIGGSFGVICQITPPSTDNVCNSVKITFKTGFGDTANSIPEDIKTAMKMDINFLYNNRGDCVPSSGSGSCTGGCVIGSKAIYKNYKILNLVGSGNLDYV